MIPSPFLGIMGGGGGGIWLSKKSSGSIESKLGSKKFPFPCC